MKQLRLSATLTIPQEAVTQTFAILGKRGSGKTTTATVLTEELLDAGHHVVVIDPLDVTWGLRSSRDGKSAGYPITVLGGDHADLPLEATAGAVLADFVVQHHSPVILSLRHFSMADQRRFVTDFCEKLYALKGQTANRVPLHLVIDEADEFAPQRIPSGHERMFGAIDRIVRRGRSAGLGVTLISQRAAVLNKDVLSQAEVLICHQTVSPQDRKALEAWIQAHDAHGQAATFMGSLASLARGEAWVWSPGWLDVFQRVAIRDRKTFDSSATPKAGAVAEQPKRLAPVDLDALRTQIASTIEKAKADDPKALRAEIAGLRKELASKQQAAAPAPAGKRVEVPVLTDGDRALLDKLLSDFAYLRSEQWHGNRALVALGALQAAHEKFIDAWKADYTQFLAGLEQRLDSKGFEKILGKLATVTPPQPALVTRHSTPRPEVQSPKAEGQKRTAPASNGHLPGVQQKVLNALAELEQLGAETPDRELVAFMAGYSNVTSKGFANAIGALRSGSLVSYPGNGTIALTSDGRGHANPPDAPRSAREVQDRVIGMLGGASGRILKPLIEAYPNALERHALADLAGYGNVTSKGFANAIGRLRTLGFIDYPDRGTVAARPVLFLEGA